MPRSDCARAQSDLGMRRLHRFSDDVAHTNIILFLLFQFVIVTLRPLEGKI